MIAASLVCVRSLYTIFFQAEYGIRCRNVTGVQTCALPISNKILWHGFISLNEEMSRKIVMPEKCMRLVKRTFGEFFRDMGLDPKNMDLICSLHKDKPQIGRASCRERDEVTEGAGAWMREEW